MLWVKCKLTSLNVSNMASVDNGRSGRQSTCITSERFVAVRNDRRQTEHEKASRKHDLRGTDVRKELEKSFQLNQIVIVRSL